jgi:hypothetical protein
MTRIVLGAPQPLSHRARVRLTPPRADFRRYGDPEHGIEGRLSFRSQSILSLLTLAAVAFGPSAPPPVTPPVEPPASSAMATAAKQEAPPVAPPASPAVKTGPVPASPQMKSFKVGAFTVVALRDATFVAANDNKVIGVGLTPEAVAVELKKAGLPEDRIELNVGALLVKTGKQTVLLDSGLGDGPLAIKVRRARLEKLAKDKELVFAPIHVSRVRSSP